MARPRPASQPLDFEALVQQAQRPVLRYLGARTASTAEASDLCQETFVRAYCALAEGQQVEHPIPWLLAIARHVHLEAVRNHRYERQLLERMSRTMGLLWESPWHEKVERRLVVADALEGLSADLREPVLLHYFGGLSVSEVAGHLEITASAVKTRLWRARQALRGELEVLVSDAEKKSTLFSIPRDLAARARLLAERPPIYDSLIVGLQVGGIHSATAPMFEEFRPAGMLTLDDVKLAAQRLHAVRVAGDRQLATKLELWPLFEPFYHPEAAAVWSFLRSAEIGTEAFQDTGEGRLAITDRWQLGTAPHAPERLADFRQAGLQHIWFTFVGLGETHDELCRRPGAFSAAVTAMERCREAGIETGANIVVSTRSVGQVKPLAELILSLGAERFIPTYVMVWSRRCPAYEEIRPTPEDLVGLPLEGMEVNWGYQAFWEKPMAHTEKVLTRAAMSTSQEPKPRRHPKDGGRSLPLLVTANLDLSVYSIHGEVPPYRLGNLRDNSPQQLYRAVRGAPLPPEPPSDAELAARYGDKEATAVHMGLGWLRPKWLEAWRLEHGIPWVRVPLD